MKRFLSITLLLMILFLSFSIGKVNAVALDTITIDTSKTTVNPGEDVTLVINFGKALGSYTFDVAYDNKLLEYVNCEGGTPNDTGTKVRVTFYDSTGGTSPRTDMKITFRAKEGITTSNPTDLSVTAEGLANNDASESYDDITIPIVKNIVVEPKYEEYQIDLSYTGNILVDQEKEMTLTISSAMGKNYDHARIVAQATTPDGGTVTLKGTDEQQLEHDIIQSGWGDASGYQIGGQNMKKVLSLRANFTKAGAYSITINLIDRDSSDAVIASKTFSLTALTEEQNNQENTNIPTENETTNQGTNNEGTTQNANETTNNQEELPKTLPKTGRNIYISIIILTIALITTMVVLQKKNKF